jgi:4'-phosphopantetheinyl transferase EntD
MTMTTMHAPEQNVRTVHHPAPAPPPVEAEIARLFPVPTAVRIASGPGDAEMLYPSERHLVADAVASRRGEFAAGRNAARAALRALNIAPCALDKQADGTVRWPAGIFGSITHIDGFCAAVVTRSAHSVGIDAAAREVLAPALAALICTEHDLATIARLPAAARQYGLALIFSAKEAFYKAYFPLARRFLEFSDVSLTPAAPAQDDAGTFRIRFTRPCLPLDEELSGFHGSWRMCGDLILTAATAPAV